MKNKTLILNFIGINLSAVFLIFSLTSKTPQEEKPTTPGEGFTIHVTAPHIMDGHLVDPMHHYCKVISEAPIIQCLMFNSTDPNARLLGIEYIVAKSQTRTSVPLGAWNKYWHDHAIEIAAGVVGLPDMNKEDAAATAELVSTTDGIVFITWPASQKFPTSEVKMAQAISHEIMTPEEYQGWKLNQKSDIQRQSKE